LKHRDTKAQRHREKQKRNSNQKLHDFLSLCLRGSKQLFFIFETQRREDTEAQRKTSKEFKTKILRDFVSLCLCGSKQIFFIFETQRHEDTEAQSKAKQENKIKTSCLRVFVPSWFKTTDPKKLFLNKLFRADHFVVSIYDLYNVKLWV
jgi:hypothetical protein